ncbi:MAG: hypothetical protein GY803_07215, partial [Chloroflexi bacterium]|nr:hypothetical protein [Chloroflexota bacterium]
MDDMLIERPREMIFNLLSAARRRPPSVRALRERLARRPLVYGDWQAPPGFAFWLRLCRAAALLDEAATLFVADWLAMPPGEQFVHL